jgi:hypothetical protein
MTYDGTTWSSATQLDTNATYGSIALGTSSDNSRWLFSWENNGVVKYREYESSTWGSVTTISSGSDNKFPSLMETLSTSSVPIIWTKGSSDSYELSSGVVP